MECCWSTSDRRYFSGKNSAQLQYKRALRQAKNDSDSIISNELSYNLLSRDSNKFWTNWNKIESRNSAVSCIDDQISHKDIANTFAQTFSKVYTDVNHDSQSALKEKYEQSFSQYSDSHGDDDVTPHFISWSEFLVCLSKMKTGKATGSFVKPQHLFHGSPLLSVHIHFLFNSLIQHEYVPCDFLQTIVTPVIKDTSGNHSDSANYHPVTLSNLFSTLFNMQFH